MGAIIETKQLTHTYSQGTPFEHTALDSVDFSAQPGEYLAIIGRTGSGTGIPAARPGGWESRCQCFRFSL